MNDNEKQKLRANVTTREVTAQEMLKEKERMKLSTKPLAITYNKTLSLHETSSIIEKDVKGNILSRQSMIDKKG